MKVYLDYNATTPVDMKRFMQCSHISTTISVIRQVLTVTELKQNWLWKELETGC